MSNYNRPRVPARALAVGFFVVCALLVMAYFFGWDAS
jgi:hypothetical protein